MLAALPVVLTSAVISKGVLVCASKKKKGDRSAKKPPKGKEARRPSRREAAKEKPAEKPGEKSKRPSKRADESQEDVFGRGLSKDDPSSHKPRAQKDDRFAVPGFEDTGPVYAALEPKNAQRHENFVRNQKKKSKESSRKQSKKQADSQKQKESPDKKAAQQKSADGEKKADQPKTSVYADAPINPIVQNSPARPEGAFTSPIVDMPPTERRVVEVAQLNTRDEDLGAAPTSRDNLFPTLPSKDEIPRVPRREEREMAPLQPDEIAWAGIASNEPYEPRGNRKASAEPK
ncbi:hypothetical protein M3Y99_00263600 [Aphelenchoides fujianensis]|nr:hypothetical protein M3Y99_00263600 [Aphelenchoides fujianensis]